MAPPVNPVRSIQSIQQAGHAKPEALPVARDAPVTSPIAAYVILQHAAGRLREGADLAVGGAQHACRVMDFALCLVQGSPGTDGKKAQGNSKDGDGCEKPTISLWSARQRGDGAPGRA